MFRIYILVMLIYTMMQEFVDVSIAHPTVQLALGVYAIVVMLVFI